MDESAEELEIYGETIPDTTEKKQPDLGNEQANNSTTQQNPTLDQNKGSQDSEKPSAIISTDINAKQQETDMPARQNDQSTEVASTGVTVPQEGGENLIDSNAMNKNEAQGVKEDSALPAEKSNNPKETSDNMINSDAKSDEAEDKDDQNEDEDDEDDDDDDEEEEDDEDDDDDFDVIVNNDDPEPQTKQNGAPFGSIGKVRLTTNKWQRQGYVPPERVSIVPKQGLGKPGGILSMLPTPTMQIGVSQKSVYDIEIGKLTEKPWLDRNADLSDYFNYGFNEDTWRIYCERQKQMRLEASMLAKIKTVDGNKNQNNVPTRVNQVIPKLVTSTPIVNRPPEGIVTQPNTTNPGNILKPPSVPPPGHAPPPPPGLNPGITPGMGPGMTPGMTPGMPVPAGVGKGPNIPGMPPFPFPPGAVDGKNGAFPPFQPFPPVPPGAQRNGDGKGNRFFFPGMPGMPGMPMPPLSMMPGAVPPNVNKGNNNPRNFPGPPQPNQKSSSQNPKQQKNNSGQNQQDGQNQRGTKRPPPQQDQNSRMNSGNNSRNQSGYQQSRQGSHDDDRRQRRGGDRRHGYDRGGQSGNHRDGGDSRNRSDDRYNDRGYDRRRSGWNESRDEGHERQRGRGYDNQKYSDHRRDYDRDRDRDYRKRSSGNRDYDDDRKRSRR